MRARLTDPLGPFWRRMLPGPSPKTRDVEVALGSGVISFRDSLLVRRVRARDIVGASTARTRTGVALSLVTSWRGRRPVTFEVANEDEATEIRRALGIGHRGFGEIGLPTDRDVAPKAERIAGVGATIGAAASFATIFEGPSSDRWLAALISLAPMLFYTLLPFFVVAAIAVRRRMVGGSFFLSERGAHVRVERGWSIVDYADIRDVYADEHGLRFTMHHGSDVAVRARAGGRWGHERPSREEIDVVAAQIVSAVQRTRGAGEPAPSLPLRVADLAKTEDEPLAWLARLDATAASLSGDGGYRGAAFDESDLWKTVESADAPSELRAAAARVLVRAVGERARTKLDEILPRVRVADDERRIRIAVDDDTERAAVAWANFEKHDARRRRAG